jgi:hypothetical protein
MSAVFHKRPLVWILASLLSTAVSTPAFALQAPAGNLQKALVLLSKEKIQEAYALLEKVSPDDPSFTLATVELQKIHYRTEDWQKFFAYALFYRKGVLTSREQAVQHFQARMISLEALALSKHCQWKEASDLIHSVIQSDIPMSDTDKSELQETLAYLKLQKGFAEIARARESSSKPSPFFNSSSYWNLSHEQMMRLPHPKHLRVVVKSRCGEGA